MSAGHVVTWDRDEGEIAPGPMQAVLDALDAAGVPQVGAISDGYILVKDGDGVSGIDPASLPGGITLTEDPGHPGLYLIG